MTRVVPGYLEFRFCYLDLGGYFCVFFGGLYGVGKFLGISLRVHFVEYSFNVYKLEVSYLELRRSNLDLGYFWDNLDLKYFYVFPLETDAQ